MRKLLITFVAFFLGILCFAQEFITIKGSVSDPNGKPVAGASVVAVGTKLAFRTSAAGTFEARIPNTVNYLQVKKAGFLSQNVKVGATVVRVVLKVDEAAKAAADKAAADKAAAEKASAEKAAAEKAAAQKAAAEKAAAEKTAAQKAAADKAAAEKTAAEKAAAEKAAAEKAATEKAEAERIAAEKAAAQKAAAEKAAAEKAAAEKAAAEKAEAERIAAEAAAAAKATAKKASRGFQHTVAVSYSITSPAVRYHNVGLREPMAHPVQIDYTLGYRFSPIFALGISAGYTHYFHEYLIMGEDLVDANGVELNKVACIPVCLNAKFTFGKRLVHPLFSASAGLDLYHIDRIGDAPAEIFSAGAGIEIRKGYRSGLQMLAGYSYLPPFGANAITIRIGYMF